VCTLGTGSAWARETLILHFMVSSGAQRTAWVSLVQGFAAAHPDIRVVDKEFAQEQYKQHFERYLTEDKVDIAFWFAGERMQSLVHKRLLAPLDPVFVNATATQALARAPLLGGVVDGQHYAFPVTY
jgi:ABC-type glycerol-3-phosphate transport system substrate-binding protein